MLTALLRPFRHENDILITWSFSSICNYNCSYCHPSLHDNRHGFPKYDKVVDFFKNLKISKPDSNLYLEILGGEPTLWKKLPEFLEVMKAIQVHVEVVSNASMPVKWWKEHATKIDNLNLSFHIEHADKDHFLAVCTTVSDKCRTSAEIMMLPSRFDELYEYASRLHDQVPEITVLTKPIRKDFKTELYDYTKAQLTKMERIWYNADKKLFPKARYVTYMHDQAHYRVKSKKLILDGENNFRGWKCNAGIERIYIDLDGSMYRAACFSGGSFGNINDDEITLPTTGINCPKDACACTWDIYTSKALNLDHI